MFAYKPIVYEMYLRKKNRRIKLLVFYYNSFVINFWFCLYRFIPFTLSLFLPLLPYPSFILRIKPVLLLFPLENTGEWKSLKNTKISGPFFPSNILLVYSFSSLAFHMPCIMAKISCQHVFIKRHGTDL